MQVWGAGGVRTAGLSAFTDGGSGAVRRAGLACFLPWDEAASQFLSPSSSQCSGLGIRELWPRGWVLLPSSPRAPAPALGGDRGRGVGQSITLRLRSSEVNRWTSTVSPRPQTFLLCVLPACGRGRVLSYRRSAGLIHRETKTTSQSREEPGGWAGSGRGRAQAVLPALLGVLGAATPVASRVPAVAALARSDAARAQAGFLLTAGPAEVPARVRGHRVRAGHRLRRGDAGEREHRPESRAASLCAPTCFRAVALPESVRLQLVFTESFSACACVYEGGEFQKLLQVVSSQDDYSVCGRGSLLSESSPHKLAGCAASIPDAVSLSAQRDCVVIITGPLVSVE
uniref:Uncharacterized protein n=1 Tax=Rangifer tarandus platyrhynchus TaxID=3082113 RepID=A0ACB0E670_RANTA|nr:unnamed protein product [Rangifer tarandus platyrhynchus]